MSNAQDLTRFINSWWPVLLFLIFFVLMYVPIFIRFVMVRWFVHQSFKSMEKGYIRFIEQVQAKERSMNSTAHLPNRSPEPQPPMSSLAQRDAAVVSRHPRPTNGTRGK